MNPRPYTPKLMDVVREAPEVRGGRFEALHAEAVGALAAAVTSLRAVRDGYRDAYRDELGRWQSLRDELSGEPGDGHGRADFERLSGEITRRESELTRLDLAQRSIENAARLLAGDEPAVGPDQPPLPADVALRIVEAQEAERSRLAQEVHDGPAQALTNAIFQVEYIERVLDHDQPLARSELRFLRQQLRRELGDVRTFISQLRPRVLDQLGLDGSIRETAENMAALTGLPIEVDLDAPGSRLNDAQQTVVLRLVQEALQNVRKHASAAHAAVSSRVEDDTWTLEIRDDGRGFDVDTVAARGRRNFGLQFMRERAELIGARFEVRSRPDAGTVVWLAIPLREESR